MLAGWSQDMPFTVNDMPLVKTDRKPRESMKQFDIDNPNLPDWIGTKAFGSGDYPFDARLKRKEYDRNFKGTAD